ncbi:MAG: TIGR04283 family arsenosugar biosynthesis glycosyltransferase [Gemmatimonadetes bacterium]|nr:TIGR04283 family arsenosugar biosynthesis glycosyltransferase [Gemmatimonadota bacterium]
MNASPAALTVIIPALDEERCLGGLLSDLRGTGARVVVVDGGSRDATVQIAREHGARVLDSNPGRGTQLNAGAAVADTKWLLFLHADSRLAPGSLQALQDFLSGASPLDFAHYRFQLDGRRLRHRIIEFGQRVRERLFRLPYGDQGLLVSHELFVRIGGYRAWPIMEDVDIVRRLSREGRRTTLPAPLRTSARRYDTEGWALAWMRNVVLMTLFHAGASPEKLARHYAPQSASPTPAPPSSEEVTAPTIVLFAKAPTPGRVKTRLAAGIGDVEAVRIYRAIGRATLDALRGGPHRLIVYFDPPGPDALEATREWLGSEGVEYRPQSDGDLGRRMLRAFEACLEDSSEVCVIGTDIPGIDGETTREAFRALRNRDVVLGPTTDGGYYLIALREIHPTLFEGVAWSTPSVLEVTRTRAADSGLSVALLDQKTDVDTARDVPEELRAR